MEPDSPPLKKARSGDDTESAAVLASSFETDVTSALDRLLEKRLTPLSKAVKDLAKKEAAHAIKVDAVKQESKKNAAYLNQCMEAVHSSRTLETKDWRIKRRRRMDVVAIILLQEVLDIIVMLVLHRRCSCLTASMTGCICSWMLGPPEAVMHERHHSLRLSLAYGDDLFYSLFLSFCVLF